MRVTALREILAIAMSAGVGVGCKQPVEPPTMEAPAPRGTKTAPEVAPKDVVSSSQFEAPFACTEGLERLLGALGADYVEHRRYAAGRPSGKPAGGVGEPCAHATDKPACMHAIEASTSTDSLWPGCGACDNQPESLLVTRGDQVQLISNHKALLALFGAIDSPAKAYFLLASSGHEPMCGEPWIRAAAEGFEVRAKTLTSDCPITYAELRLLVRRDGGIRELERKVLPHKPGEGGCAGRRPPGLVRAFDRGRCAPVAGRYFAQLSRLEAASIVAFDVLGAELRAYAAPARLVSAVARARADEVTHAELTATLARRFGATPRGPRVHATSVRSLRAIAVENAREGCVRETWGALEARWQATHASDPHVRRCLRRIAGDELRHAALSWQIAAWVEPQLDAAGQRAARRARHSAVTELARELAIPTNPELVGVVGLPGRQARRALLSSLRHQLWSA